PLPDAGTKFETRPAAAASLCAQPSASRSSASSESTPSPTVAGRSMGTRCRLPINTSTCERTTAGSRPQDDSAFRSVSVRSVEVVCLEAVTNPNPATLPTWPQLSPTNTPDLKVGPTKTATGPERPAEPTVGPTFRSGVPDYKRNR